MRRLWTRFFGRECDHQHVLVVTSVGVRRSICEQCGHISFTFQEMIQTPATAAKAEEQDLPQAEGF